MVGGVDAFCRRVRARMRRGEARVRDGARCRREEDERERRAARVARARPGGGFDSRGFGRGFARARGEAPGEAAMGAYACARARGRGEDISARARSSPARRALEVSSSARRAVPRPRARSPARVDPTVEAEPRTIRTDLHPSSPRTRPRRTLDPSPSLRRKRRAEASVYPRPPVGRGLTGIRFAPLERASLVRRSSVATSSRARVAVGRRDALRYTSVCASMVVVRNRGAGDRRGFVPSCLLRRRGTVVDPSSSHVSPLASFPFALSPTLLTARRPSGGGGWRGTWTR